MIVTMMKYSHLKKLYNRYDEFETISHHVSIASLMHFFKIVLFAIYGLTAITKMLVAG